MKKLKMIISLVLIAALTAGLAITGTLAYLTDRESKANVFTVGNVAIELKENFEQGAELIPGEKITKEVSIKNTGENEAWVWYTYAVPTALINTGENASKNVIHFNIPGRYWDTYRENSKYWEDGQTEAVALENTWHWEKMDVDAVTLDEVEYTVVTVLYNGTLDKGEETTLGLEQVYLDTHVDIDPNGDWYWVENGVATPIEWNSNTNGNPIIYVSAYAIQKDGFATVNEAYDAYQTQWGNNGSEYKDPSEVQMPGDPAPENAEAEYNGTTYKNIYDAVAVANANDGGEIILKGSGKLDKPVEINSNITIKGEKALTTYTRAEGYTGTMFSVGAGATLTTENLVLDGAGATATGNLIATQGDGSIVLNAGSVLQNNHGAHAVSLATRGGGTLILNGAHIINNSSDSGAIWGGGNITINEGSKINNNASTGSAGAIRMVGNCNLTMNGGEICNNKAAGDGGAIWGYGTSNYDFNGGEMSNNESVGTGGAIYTGTYSVINISGDFEMCDNKAANSGAIRLTDHTSLTMTGGKISGNTQNGESNAFNTWNNSIKITGGSISDNFSFVGGLDLTIGEADIGGVISYDLSTNHNTAYLAENFGSFKFTVSEAGEHFGNFNFKPAEGYTYTEGDEAKLICQNEGYSTYWDAATSTFRLH